MRAVDVKIKPDRSRKACEGAPLRRGFTLAELLVVMAIIVILIGLAVPMSRPALEERQVREGARQLTTVLSRARIKASELQRPCGVRLERYQDHPNSNNTCLLLRPLESPPPYSGMQQAARVTVISPSNVDPVYDLTFALADRNALASDGELEAKAWEKLIGEGDEIQFNHQGPRYSIVNPGTLDGSDSSRILGVRLDRRVDLPASGRINWPGVAFKVYRRPIPSLGHPTVMPNGSVLDLQYSGIGQRGIQFGLSSGPIDIIFAPSGEVESVYYDDQEHSAVDPIFLMIGRYDRTYGNDPDLHVDNPVGVQPEDLLRNYEDLNNLWVVITPRTGLAAGGDVYPRDEPPTQAQPTDDTATRRTILRNKVSTSRIDAANVQQSIGGR